MCSPELGEQGKPSEKRVSFGKAEVSSSGDSPESTKSTPTRPAADIVLDVCEDPPLTGRVTEELPCGPRCGGKVMIKVWVVAFFIALVGGILLASHFASNGADAGASSKKTGSLGVDGGCLAAETTLWQVPCAGDGVATPLQAQHVEVGSCVLDARGERTEVYFRSSSVADQVVLAAGEHTVSLTPGHLVFTDDGLRPAGALQVGSTLLEAEVHSVEQTRGAVELIYTLSGSLLAGAIPVSCYEHWTDPWLSGDTRLLYIFGGSHVVTSDWYRAYFDLESSFTDPWVHWLLPY